jgi:hypothetical protein
MTLSCFGARAEDLQPDHNKNHCKAFLGNWERSCISWSTAAREHAVCAQYTAWVCRDRYEYQQAPLGRIYRRDVIQWCHARGGEFVQENHRTRSCSSTADHGTQKYTVTESVNKGYTSPAHPRTDFYKYPRERELVINSRRMGGCFASALNQYDGPLSFDKDNMTCRLWPLNRRASSMDEYYNYNDGFNAIYDEDTFFPYLAVYGDRECDFETGNELDLRSWVLEQNDNSITPMKMFEESLRINEGNVWNTIMTIHQLVRNEVRWNRQRHYIYPSSQESEGVFINKLVDIRGDLRERDGRLVGDHGGSWYRIWGAMLYRLRGSDENSLDHLFGSISNEGNDSLGVDSCVTMESILPEFDNELDRLGSILKDNFTFSAGEWVKYLMAPSKGNWSSLDMRKAEINRRAGATASEMINSVLSFNDERVNTPTHSECQNLDTYITPASRSRDRKN